MLLRAYRDGTVPLDENGWFATGDAGAFDETGRLQVKGRLSDLIITGGENVWPAAVERILRQHPGVAEVAVSSRPDPEWGERLVACVVPSVPSAPPGLLELRALVADQLAAFAAPKELVILEALPKTSIGKLKRQALREQLLHLSSPTSGALRTSLSGGVFRLFASWPPGRPCPAAPGVPGPLPAVVLGECRR